MNKFFYYLAKRKRETLYFVVSVIDKDVHTDFFQEYKQAKDYVDKIKVDFGDYLKEIAIFKSTEVLSGKD